MPTLSDEYVNTVANAVDVLVGHLKREASAGWAPRVTDLVEMLLPGDGTDQGEYSKLMATSIAVLAQRLAAL